MKKILVAIGITVILAVLSLATLQIVASTIDTPTPPVASSVKATAPVTKEVPPTVDELLRLVNEERAKVGVAPLVLDPLLNQSAQFKAQDMLDRNYFSHTAPGTNTNNGLANAKQLGKKCIWISENISWGKYANTSESAMTGWRNSKAHYDAMVDPRYESTGIGIAGDKITEHFCDER